MTTETHIDYQLATLGERLIAAREAQGLTQQELAIRIGVKLKTLQDWETDENEPRANRIQMLCGLLNVSLRWLLNGEGEGVHEPASHEELAEETRDILKEIQSLRVEMIRMTQRLGKAERKLRHVLKDGF